MRLSSRTALVALALALVVMLSLAVITTLAGNDPSVQLLKNGSFENGFSAKEGCGMVGNDWECFTTGGRGGYGFIDDTWPPVVANGQHAQLVAIDTMNDNGDQNRTAGIYQRVKVIPGKTYMLDFKAMIRANDLDWGGDPYRYSVLVGFAQDGGTNWASAQWQEVNAGPIQERTNPSAYYPISVAVTAQGEYLTVFVAGRMKWGDWGREVLFDFDALKLTGPGSSATQPSEGDQLSAPADNAADQTPPAPAESQPTPAPTTPPVAQLVCDGPNLLKNGGFEDGFKLNGVAANWRAYNNGGQANFGYYDEMWPPVVDQGEHAQLLEINTMGLDAAQADRYVGIYQDIRGLTKGATYELSLAFMVREDADHSNEDPYRYEVSWGYRNGKSGIDTVPDLTAHYGIDIPSISLRTEPGSYTAYSTQFQATNKRIQLYLLGMNKWPILGREVDFDFDNVQLRMCRTVTLAPDATTPPPPADNDLGAIGPSPDVCTYVVQPGDSLYAIAIAYGTTTSELVRLNNIDNPALIRVNQVLQLPCSGGDAISYFPPPANTADVVASTATIVHVVEPGEDLGGIAERHETTIDAIRKVNNIDNANVITPGQRIRVPAGIR